MSSAIGTTATWTVYLPLIGTIFTIGAGFLSLAIAHYINSKRDRETESRKLANERKNIIGALVAELQAIEESLIKNIEATRFAQEKGYKEIKLYAPIFDRGAIYDKYISQVGSLEVSTIKSVYTAYYNVISLPDYLLYVAGGNRNPEGSNFIEINSCVAINMMEAPLKYAKEAISALEGELKKGW